MKKIKVGIIQQSNTADIRVNLMNLAKSIEACAAHGAQLIVLQELHNSLYAEQQNPEQIKELANIPVKYLKMPGVADNEWQTVYLQVKVRKGAVCTFAYSLDGKKYTTVGESFTARQGKWIGAKVGLFCVTPNEGNRGWADVDWFRMNK